MRRRRRGRSLYSGSDIGNIMWSIISLCMLLVSLTQAQRERVTNGPSGERCARRKCISGLADCVNGSTCVCRSPRGLDPNNGHFACYNPNTAYGEIYLDPRVRNPSNEIVNFPFPCRYLVTSVTTNLRIRDKNAGYCKCDIHAFNLKSRGKLYTGGYDIACKINNHLLYEKTGFSARIVGLAKNGVFTYSEQGVQEYRPHGPWDPTPVDFTGAGITIHSTYDEVNNQANFDIAPCGVSVTFVAYDEVLRLEQPQTPGLSFVVNCLHHPYYHAHDKVIVPAPVSFKGTTYKELAVPPLSITETLILRAFTAGVVQNHPGAPPQCATIGNILAGCSQENRVKSAKGCFWMPEVPKFSRCLDPGNNTEPVLSLYEKCVGVHCTGAPPCRGFINSVIATGCSELPNISPLTSILAGKFCAW